FPMHEPEGYGAANDTALAAASASGGRLVALVRVRPDEPGALEEARRGLDAGASGIKLHPRSDAFGLPHPVVAELVALAHEAGAIVLFHAGRGIPRLGQAAVELAREHPRAAIILAHAGISDLGRLAGPAAELPNLYFDTAWWQVGDLLQLQATIPPARILHASDMPYGSARFAAIATVRPAVEVGLGPDSLRAMAGGQLERLVAGETPLDLGPAPGTPPAPRLEAQRAVAYTAAAVQQTFRAGDPDEAISLARLACQHVDEDPVLDVVDELLARARQARDEEVPDAGAGASRWPGVYALLAAQLVAGTPRVGVP
ncbi:MAG TPA: amidohydrolase family protein, partial [Solirubrobacteraceae bacterium]|nr:amidohydrolase family protein [Solirubrobacteraceae bacterium]